MLFTNGERFTGSEDEEEKLFNSKNRYLNLKYEKHKLVWK